MPALPADLATMRAAIAQWAGAATGMPPFWRDQDAPPPPGPYVALKLGGWRWEGRPHIGTRSTGALTAVQEVNGMMAGTLSLQPHSAQDVSGAIAALQGAMRDPIALQAVREAGVALVDVLGTADLAGVAGARWRHVQNLDVRIRVSYETTTPTSWIETSGPRSVTVTIDGLLDLVIWT